MRYTYPLPGHEMLVPNIVKAENCTLYDANGKQYVDLEAGVWCTSIGHGHPAIKAAMLIQMDSIAHVGFTYSNEMVEQAAETVLETTNHPDGKCAFLCSGSEAIEYGIRIIRTVSDKPTILSMSDSYYGAYGDAATKLADDWHTFDWFDCGSCAEEQCSDSCPRWSAIPFDRIAGFLLEPGSSSGFVRFPPRQLIRSIANTLQSRGDIFMVNEVTTGIGRTGKWFGYQHYDVQPDIVAMGKGIGGGYPVSATSLNANIAERIGPAPIAYSQSHLNDPLGAAVAKTVLETIRDEKLIERAQTISQTLMDGLHKIADEYTAVEAVRGRGLMSIISFHDDTENSKCRRVLHTLADRGYLVARRTRSSTLRIDPALTIEEADILHFLVELRETVATI